MVLIFCIVSVGINVVFLFEFLGQFFCSNRFDIIVDGIFYFDVVVGVFKGNLLYVVFILFYNERSCCWDRVRSCVWVVDIVGVLVIRVVKLRSIVLGVLGLGYR